MSGPGARAVVLNLGSQFHSPAFDRLLHILAEWHRVVSLPARAVISSDLF